MVYISGGITNVPNFMKRFSSVENDLIKQGYEVVNPAKLNDILPKICTHADYMIVSMALLSICDTIYMLKGWEESECAREEYEWAVSVGIEIMKEV